MDISCQHLGDEYKLEGFLVPFGHMGGEIYILGFFILGNIYYLYIFAGNGYIKPTLGG